MPQGAFPASPSVGPVLGAAPKDQGTAQANPLLQAGQHSHLAEPGGLTCDRPSWATVQGQLLNNLSGLWVQPLP